MLKGWKIDSVAPARFLSDKSSALGKAPPNFDSMELIIRKLTFAKSKNFYEPYHTTNFLRTTWQT